MRSVLLILTLLFCAAQDAAAESGVEFAEKTFADRVFVVVRPRRNSELQLFWRARGTERFETVAALERSLRARSLTLHFATNAGIFEPDFAPTGLHIEEGRLLRPLNLQQGDGNFYLKPNGVFAVTPSGAAEIMPSREARGRETEFRIAVQSGPLLVVGGRINPAFNQHSKNLAVRSGIGVDGTGRIVFVLSRQAVSFYALAQFFKEREGADAALYLDGAISEFHLPGVMESTGTFAGMFGVVSR